MPKKDIDYDATDYYQEMPEDNPGRKYTSNDDETVEEGFRSSGGYNSYDDDDEGGVTMSFKKKKPDILGFLVIKKGKRKNDKYDLIKGDIIIGKSPKCCDIIIDDDGISKIHCRIRRDPEKNEFHFYDCGSTNGSLINSVEQHHVILKSHDKITLGEDVELVFVQV